MLGTSRENGYPIPKSGIIQNDPNACHGCGICELVCSLAHDGKCGTSLSRISILRNPLAGEFKQVTCKQCNHPECYFNCPVQAIVIEPQTGARVINTELCIGCGTCARVCPFNDKGLVIKRNATTNKYAKCDLCTSVNLSPQCATACPWGALEYIPAEKKVA